MSIRLLILAKRAERYPGLRNALTQDILPRLQEMVRRIDELSRRIQPLRIKNICIKESCGISLLQDRGHTFENIERNRNKVAPDNDEILGTIEYTYDENSVTLGLIRYTASNRVRNWGLGRTYGPNLLFPSTWSGAILLPANQDRAAALPTIPQPGTSAITPFHIVNLPSCGPPFATNLLEAAKTQMTNHLIASYQATDYAVLQRLVQLAQQVAAQLPA